MNVLTKIEELLFIVATYILFSLKFSSFLSDCFVLKKHLTDEFLKKSVDVVFFLSYWYPQDKYSIYYNLLGIHGVFSLFVSFNPVVKKMFF